jgi:subtilase family serine protease
MFMKLKSGFLILALGAVATFATPSDAGAQTARRLVTTAINDRVTVPLVGNTRSEANAKNDLGRVEDSLPLDHMQMLLNRPPELEAAVNKFIDQLHDRSSPLFHHWLAPEQYEAQFAPAKEDVEAVTDWLEGHGFTVNTVVNSKIIDFSGTAGQVREAFQTEIHNLGVNGVTHIANMSDPRIPVALSGIVNGIISLHDFRPHTNFTPRAGFTFSDNGETEFAVTPQDLAVIYNLNPLWSAGISGQGQTIVLIEDSDVFATADWTTFRSEFGLSSFTSGSFTTVHPAPKTGTNNCTDPKVVSGNEEEAELDVEYASAAAPSAAIELASCKDSSTTFGGLLALENILSEGGTLPGTVSISFGECEEENGATSNAAFSSTYQEAVAAGTTVFVSSGDEGAASCDADETKATHGITTSGFTTTAFNVSVGGTDFGDTFAGTNSTYWESTNSSTFESAISYVPEIPWNDSCASALIFETEGFTSASGTSGFCNSTTGEDDFLTTASGSGGPSGCFTGTAKTTGEVSGTCKGNPKPSFQSVLGNPSDGVRDIPDVSLFAANGVWGHFYVFCDSDTRDGGAKCSGTSPSTWLFAGGTSFASPIWAGFQALVNQKVGSHQGNANTVYYSLASTEYGTSGSSTCNSTLGNKVASTCIFYDVTQGDMDVNCTGKVNCFLPSGTNGILSTSSSASDPAYGTTTGWDFATGIGTVNVNNLVNNWP